MGAEDKYAGEVAYWQSRADVEGLLGNAHYRELMLLLSGKGEDFFSDKIVGDFGCGPRGSLEWMAQARSRIGIEVLANEYMRFGIRRHKMIYVRNSETEIPLPDGYLDVIFSVNSIDHAVDVERMIDECFRVLAPGGLMAMSINLDEPPSPTEPNMLTWKFVERTIIGRLHNPRFKISPRAAGPNKYVHLYAWARDGVEPPPYGGSWGLGWVAGEKL